MADLESPIQFTHGALLIGWTFATLLYGLTCSQTVTYFRRYARDHLYLKATVVILWILETVHLVLLSTSLYHYLVRQHGRQSALVPPTIAMKIQLIPASMVVGTVQYIWIMRVWTLSRNRFKTYIAYAMLSMVVADWVISLTWFANIIPIHTFEGLTQQLWHVILAIALTTLTDVIITGYFCYVAHKARDGLPGTDTLVNKLMIYGINTGVVTAFGTIGLLISVVTAPKRLYYIAIYMVLPKLYLNTHLAMLNFRKSAQSSSMAHRYYGEGSAFELTTVPLATLSRYTHFGD
ncbi:hypothetical protein EIP91_011472 [Steccherinum ochraceum]|uniref:DUF6534 domain-containing protein n=1 Tax=Steccherinum ochraceum TaxID=92696 RepID=A0A4R0R267_9APHY|nr:hypothetical protein EIP91_011472 [Steccherinum ochraceum]